MHPMSHKSSLKLKRSPLKKKSSNTVSVLKRKLWEVFSKYIRERDNYTCFTCGRKGEGSGMHAGHFIAKSAGGLLLYFHEKNVNAQCYQCNINLGGNQYIYGKKLGKTAEELYKLKGKVVKWSTLDYEEKIALYKEKLIKLNAR